MAGWADDGYDAEEWRRSPSPDQDLEDPVGDAAGGDEGGAGGGAEGSAQGNEEATAEEPALRTEEGGAGSTATAVHLPSASYTCSGGSPKRPCALCVLAQPCATLPLPLWSAGRPSLACVADGVAAATLGGGTPPWRLPGTASGRSTRTRVSEEEARAGRRGAGMGPDGRAKLLEDEAAENSEEEDEEEEKEVHAVVVE
jgi:hypothetical protein